MKALYVVRHGIAEPHRPDVEDDARELTRKGKDKMKLVAKGLADADIRFDVIMTSPLARAFQTARILEKYCPGGGSVMVADSLKPEASYDELVDGLNRLDGVDTVAVVGHEPFLSGFVSYCLTGERRPFVTMKKGGIARLEIDGAVRPGQCVLAWLLEPGQIARL